MTCLRSDLRWTCSGLGPVTTFASGGRRSVSGMTTEACGAGVVSPVRPVGAVEIAAFTTRLAAASDAPRDAGELVDVIAALEALK